jgi:NhaP-type Na+/H+ or K+/H+ antiporter
MSEAVLGSVALVVIGWAAVSNQLGRWNITGPIVLTLAGFFLANPWWGPLVIDIGAESAHFLVEITLALLLFADAARVNIAALRPDRGVLAALLGIGLPLSVIVGGVVAAWLFGEPSWALAAFVGAALAPTDAALSAQVINDQRIPVRVRSTLNVESGLNDGIVTPIVVFTLAIAAGQLGVEGGSHDPVRPLIELAFGVVVGLCLGWLSAVLIGLAMRRDWIASGGRRLIALATALGSFAISVAIDGNGFIAAFVAGITFGAVLPRGNAGSASPVAAEAAEFPELVGEVLGLMVWFLFGAVLVPLAFEHFSVLTLVYALLSLTVVRMLPVAVALLRAGMDRATVAFVGWFGPRGIASVVFALLAVEELGGFELVDQVVSVVSFTVLCSVVLHGLSAGPLGRRYAAGRVEEAQAGRGSASPLPRSRRQSHAESPGSTRS